MGFDRSLECSWGTRSSAGEDEGTADVKRGTGGEARARVDDVRGREVAEVEKEGELVGTRVGEMRDVGAREDEGEDEDEEEEEEEDEGEDEGEE